MNELKNWKSSKICLEDFEKIMEKTAEPIFVINEFHELIYANKAFYNFIWKTPDELLCKVLDLWDDEKHETFFDWNNAIFESWEEIINQKNLKHSTKDSECIQIKRSLISNSRWEKLIIGVINYSKIQKKSVEIIDKTRMIIKSIKAGIIVYDANLNIVEWNTFMEELTWYKAIDVIGKNPIEIFPFLIEQGVISRLYEILEWWPDFTQEFPFNLPNWRVGFVCDNSQALRDPYGKIIWILGLVNDITDHKELEKNAFFLREAQEKANIWSYKANFTVWSWESSAVFDRIFGTNKECLSIPDWLDFIHPDDYDMIITYLSKEIIEKKNKFDKEYRIIKKDDWKTRRIQQSGEIICDENWKIISMTWIIRDITDRKKSEEEKNKLIRSYKIVSKCNEALFRIKTEKELLDTICNIFIEDWWYRMSWIGYIENWSKKVKPISQAWIEEGYLSNIEISYDKNELSWCWPTWLAIRKKEYFVARNIATNDTFIPWRDAAIKRWYASSIALPLIIENKTIGALMIYSSDPNDFNNEEIKLLEKLTDSLSYWINNIRIKEENKKNEEYLRTQQRMDTVGTLAGWIAHDFNNMLGWIMWNLELLLSEPLAQKQKEYGINSLKWCEILTQLIRKMQSLTKNQFSEKNCINIRQIISETFDILSHTTDKIINKIIDYKWNSFYVIWNNIELQQVLLNLGTNSIRAIEKRWAKDWDFIKITTTDYIKNDNSGNLTPWEYIHITFEDNWIWMSDEVLLRAFDPFFSTGEKGVQKWQGLWLSMVYSIIQNHNGSIHIESKEWKWTTVHIYLPKAQQLKKDTQKENNNEFPENKNILVIDDEVTLCNLVKTILERKGCKVLLANDWLEWLKIFSKNMDSIDLVILDLTMPKMSGQDVLKKLLELKKDVKVIIASWQSDEVIREWILQEAKGVLHKPFRMNTFIQTIQQALSEN